MLNRSDLYKVLARHITDEIVVSSYASAIDWKLVTERPLNYFSHGAMGLCSSHGLGLALARPERKVVVLDGDGSLLMNLGTLVTIAAVKPRNFLHFVNQNGTYEANGGHPIPNPGVDFSGIARSAGIEKVYSFSELSDFEAKIGTMLQEAGPVFCTLYIQQGVDEPTVDDYKDMYKPERRTAFRAALDA